MLHIPIRHTRVKPSREFTSMLNELSHIALLAKVLGNSTLYEQSKEMHDRLVQQYRVQTEPKKKGFWEQFKDNLLNRDMDTYIAEHVDYLEENPYLELCLKLYSEEPRYKLEKSLRESLDKFNQKYK